MTEEMEKRAVEGIERIASALERMVRILSRSSKRDRALLSMRRAAEELGVDRNSTLCDLIDAKRIRTIKMKNGRKLIPASEIRRFTEIFDASRPGPDRRPRSQRSAEDLRQAILSIKL